VDPVSCAPTHRNRSSSQQIVQVMKLVGKLQKPMALRMQTTTVKIMGPVQRQPGSTPATDVQTLSHPAHYVHVL
jgi:hypothetical protein